MGVGFWIRDGTTEGGKRHLAFMGLFVLFVSWSALFCLVIAYICIFQFSLVGRVCTNVERMDVACIMNEVKIYPNECSLLSKHYSLLLPTSFTLSPTTPALPLYECSCVGNNPTCCPNR